MVMKGRVVRWRGNKVVVAIEDNGKTYMVVARANGRRYPGIGSTVYVATPKVGDAVLV